MTWVLWFALACGAAGALNGNRTALALLISALLCMRLDKAGVPFDWTIWTLIDLLVIGIVVIGPRTPTDKIIIGLFPIAWYGYLQAEDLRFIICFPVVVVQLLLTFPRDKARHIARLSFARWKANFRYRNEWTNLDRKALA